MTVGQYRTHSWPDNRTNAWMAVEKTSGKVWKEFPDDYMVPAFEDPKESFIVVTGGGEEQFIFVNGRTLTTDPAFSIDIWK